MILTLIITFLIIWRAYVQPSDILKYAAFQLVFVFAPGWLAYRALIKHPVSLSVQIGVGWAVGLSLATVFYFLGMALNMRAAFAAFPLGVAFVSGAQIWLARQKNKPAQESLPSADLSKHTAITLFAIAGVAFCAYLYLGMFLPQPLPGTFGMAALNNTLVSHIALAAETLMRYPMQNPQLSNMALSPGLNGVMHVAAAAHITGVSLPVLLLRLNPVALSVCLFFALYAAGKSVDGSRASGLLSLILVMFIGIITLPIQNNTPAVFTAMWSNPSHLLGLALFGALLVEFIHTLRNQTIHAPIVILLMLVCVWVAPQALWLMAVGAGCVMAINMARHQPTRASVVAWLGLAMAGLALGGIVAPYTITLTPFSVLLAALAGSLVQFIAGGWALSRAKPASTLLMALAAMFVVGLLVSISPAGASPEEKQSTLNFGYVAGSVLAATGLRQLLQKTPGAAPSAQKAATYACAGLAALGLITLPVISVFPSVAKLAAGKLVYATPEVAMSSSLYIALNWLESHSTPDQAFATNRTDERNLAKDGYYSAFAQRRVFLGASNEPHSQEIIQRQALAKAVFEDGSGEALKQMRDQYGVQFLVIDRLHGEPLSPNLYSLVSPLYTNDEADVFEVVVYDNYPLPKRISEQGGTPYRFVSEVVIDGLTEPTSMEFAKDGRLFIGEKSGRILVYQNGALLPDPFIDLSNDVNNTFDRGLLGFALDPAFPQKPYLYVFYVYDPPGVEPDGMGSRVSRVERIMADPQNTNRAATAPDARLILMGKNSTLQNIGNINDTFDQTSQSCFSEAGGYVEDCLGEDSLTHAGGGVVFAQDGSLWISIGEGGLAGTDMRAVRAQSLESLAGRIVRINPQNGQGYPDNPFYDGNPNSNRSKTISYGLRNPFRFLLHPQTKELYIGDVGQITWEEVNKGVAKNFGWPCYEGDNDGNAVMLAFAEAKNARVRAVCDPLYAAKGASIQAPIYSYKHLRSESVIMGAVYTGTNYPAYLQGALVFADYNWDKITYMRIQDGESRRAHPLVYEVRETATSGQAQIAQAPDGNLWYVLYTATEGKGQIRRILYTNKP